MSSTKRFEAVVEGVMVEVGLSAAAGAALMLLLAIAHDVAPVIPPAGFWPSWEAVFLGACITKYLARTSRSDA